MAEPARNYDNNDSEEPIIRPDLKALEGGGETSEPVKGHLHSVSGGDTEGKAKGGATPSEIKSGEETGSDSQTVGSSTATQEERNALTKQIGKGYSDDSAPGGTPQRVITAFRDNKRKFFIGGAAGGGLIAIIVFGILAILPLELNGLVQKMEDKAFGSSESAVQGRVEKLFDNYLKQHVIPYLGAGKCNRTGTIDKTCEPAIQGESSSARLYRTWRDARIENKMSTDYGLEVARVANTSNYTIKVNNKVSSLDVDGWKKNYNEELWQATGGRNDVRTKFREAVQGETFWNRTLFRFKVGRLLEAKYGIRRCIFACKQQDNFDDWKDNKTNALKAALASRVLETRSTIIGPVIACVIDTTCDNAETRSPDKVERQDAIEKQIQQKLDEHGKELSTETVAKIASLVGNLNDYKQAGSLSTYFFQKYVYPQLNDKIQALLENDLTGPLGFINTALGVVSKAKKLGGQLKKYGYVVKTTEMVAFYMMMRTTADECKGGHCNPDLLGSMTSAFNDSSGDAQHQNQPAGISPVYDTVMNSPAEQTSFLNLFNPTTAYAATVGPNVNPTYTCDNDKPVPTGMAVCPEESTTVNNGVTKLSGLLTDGPLSFLGGAADIWAQTGGTIINFVNGFVGKAIKTLTGQDLGSLFSKIASVVPGLSYLQDHLSTAIQSLLSWLGNDLISNPITDANGGARNFDMAYAGADAAASAYGQYGIGGRQLSPQEVSAIQTSQEDQRQQQFSDQPFFARMFSTTDPDSLVSSLALNMPSSVSSFTQGSFADLLSNPLGQLSKGFSSLLTTHKTYAASVTSDPFGIPQTGYALDDPAINTDPNSLTDAKCQQMNNDWADGTGQFAGSLIPDPVTGTDIHTKTDPCLLEQAAVGSAGGFFSTDVLTPDDLADNSTTTANPADTTTTATQAGNNVVYLIGDSLTAGMRDEGDLVNKLKAEGWATDQIEATIGINVNSSLAKIDADQAHIKQAGTVVVMLGTNPAPDSPGFNQDIKSMIDKIRSYNKTAVIYWMNAKTGNSAYPTVDSSLDDQAGGLGYQVIDWASEFDNNQAQYPLTADKVHLTAAGYSAKAAFLANSLGQAPKAPTANLDDQLLNDLMAEAGQQAQSNAVIRELQTVGQWSPSSHRSGTSESSIAYIATRRRPALTKEAWTTA